MPTTDYHFDDRNMQWCLFPGFEGLYYWVLGRTITRAGFKRGLAKQQAAT